MTTTPLWVPGNADVGAKYAARVQPVNGREVVDRCRVPTKDGPCGHPFYADEREVARVEHIRACVSRNHDVIVAAREQQHPEILKPWDPEYADWLAANKRGIDEGRVRW